VQDRLVVQGGSLRTLITAAAITAALLAAPLLPTPLIAADIVDAATTPGTGRLTMCRNWLIHNSCTTHKVALPETVEAGDKVALSFGSNTKHYVFQVVRIRYKGDSCTILSHTSGAGEDGQRIEVAGCSPTTKPAAEAR
jgi:hypothetical protein